MFYKHWKKIALALTGIFWAACDDSSSAEECLYGPPSYYGLPESSASDPESSSEETNSSSSRELMHIALDYGIEYDPDSIVVISTLCFNDSVQNVEGRVFKIIDCTDGNKYLRDPSNAGYEGVVLPEGVKIFAPNPGSEKAPNCTSNQDICIERDPSKPIEQDSLAGCHPIIDCPEKPHWLLN